MDENNLDEVVADFMRYLRTRAPDCGVCLFVFRDYEVAYAANVEVEYAKEAIRNFLERTDLVVEERQTHNG